MLNGNRRLMIKPPQPCIGACSWQHAQWQDEFYPEDMPDDWRLAYYANEFLTVMVPQDQWSAAGSEEYRSWMEECAGDFRFFLEYRLDSIAALDRLSAIFTQTDWRPETLGGLVLDVGGEEFLYQLQAKQARFGCPVFVRYSGDELADPAVWEHLNRVWQAQHPCPVPTDFSTGIGVVQDRDLMGDQDLRNVIESFMHRGGADLKESYLFFCGKPPSLDTMRKAVIISQLL